MQQDEYSPPGPKVRTINNSKSFLRHKRYCRVISANSKDAVWRAWTAAQSVPKAIWQDCLYLLAILRQTEKNGQSCHKRQIGSQDFSDSSFK